MHYVIHHHGDRLETIGLVADWCSDCGKVQPFRLCRRFVNCFYLYVIIRLDPGVFDGIWRQCRVCKHHFCCTTGQTVEQYDRILSLKEGKFLSTGDLLRRTNSRLLEQVRLRRAELGITSWGIEVPVPRPEYGIAAWDAAAGMPFTRLPEPPLPRTWSRYLLFAGLLLVIFGLSMLFAGWVGWRDLQEKPSENDGPAIKREVLTMEKPPRMTPFAMKTAFAIGGFCSLVGTVAVLVSACKIGVRNLWRAVMRPIG